MSMLRIVSRRNIPLAVAESDPEGLFRGDDPLANASVALNANKHQTGIVVVNRSRPVAISTTALPNCLRVLRGTSRTFRSSNPI